MLGHLLFNLATNPDSVLDRNVHLALQPDVARQEQHRVSVSLDYGE